MYEFVKQFIQHPLQIASLVPSGRRLARRIAQSIDFAVADRIVELGPGTGIVTSVLLHNRMKPTAELTAIEINARFCDILRGIPDPRLQVVEGDARELRRYAPEADYVVSELPLANFKEEDRERILRDIREITRYGYIQLHHSPFGGGYIREHFENVTRAFVIRNLPPAFVYTARA